MLVNLAAVAAFHRPQAELTGSAAGANARRQVARVGSAKAVMVPVASLAMAAPAKAEKAARSC